MKVTDLETSFRDVDTLVFKIENLLRHTIVWKLGMCEKAAEWVNSKSAGSLSRTHACFCILPRHPVSLEALLPYSQKHARTANHSVQALRAQDTPIRQAVGSLQKMS